MATMLRPIALLAGLVTLAAACSSGGSGGATPAPPAGASGLELTQTCRAPDAGYQIRYPAGWHTNDPAAGGPCRFFHSEPFALPLEAGATGVTISFATLNVPFDRVVPTGGDAAMRVHERTDASVAGRRAARVESTPPGEGPDAGAQRTVHLFVDLGGRTLVGTTRRSRPAGTPEANISVLEEMMATLTVLGAEGTCSAAGLSADLPAQPTLPGPVAETRQALARAAVACDYAALTDLARRGDRPFTYSLEPSGSPGEHWQRIEEQGRGGPMRALVELLRTPVATGSRGTTAQYLWPAAYLHPRWSDVPAADRQALRPLYGDDDFARWQQLGSYGGYRVGIEPSGEWLFFLTRD